MKISEKKRQAAYTAISDIIMRERLSIRKNGVPNDYEMDVRLFNMQGDIWKGIKQALQINYDK